MAEFKKKYKTKFARLIEALTSSPLPACAPQRALRGRWARCWRTNAGNAPASHGCVAPRVLVAIRQECRYVNVNMAITAQLGATEDDLGRCEWRAKNTSFTANWLWMDSLRAPGLNRGALFKQT